MILASQQPELQVREEVGKPGPWEMRLSWCTGRCKSPGNTSHICWTFKFRINAQHDLLPAINEQEIIICPYTPLLLHLHQDGEGQHVTASQMLLCAHPDLLLHLS